MAAWPATTIFLSTVTLKSSFSVTREAPVAASDITALLSCPRKEAPKSTRMSAGLERTGVEETRPERSTGKV